MKKRFLQIGKKLLAVCGFLLFVVVFATAVGMSPYGTPAACQGESPEPMVANQGDSLWALSERYHPGDDTKAVSARVVEMNNLRSPSLVAGQRLKHPLTCS